MMISQDMVFLLAQQAQTLDLSAFFQSQGLGWLIAYLIGKELLPFLKERFTNDEKNKIEREKEEREDKARNEERLYKLLDKSTEKLEAITHEIIRMSLANTALINRMESVEDAQTRILSILEGQKRQQRTQTTTRKTSSLDGSSV